jgi:pilus assembly protein FimV
MNRSLKLSILLALGLGSVQASALELGQIQIKSALGQPLLAEIPLSPESPADMRSLSARLASPEDFARAGIAGGRPSIPLQFSVATEGARKVIRITSSEPVSDPYLDLLVEVNSATGKSVREFAILLDPPGAAPMSSQRSATASAARSQTMPPAPPPAARSAGASNGKVGPVERGQTLTAIARQTTPAGVDENQMLLALKQANPDAFYRDNVNALKSGAVLRVPTSQEAQALGAAAALAEIRRENSDWRAGATRSPTTVADAATRADTTSAPTSAPSGGDRLALVPSKQGGSSDGSSAGSKNAAATAQLRQDLARNQETVSSLQAQSGELKSRVKDLEDINGKNQRLLSLKDSEIADLQQQLAKARKTANLPAAPANALATTAGTPAAIGNTGVASPAAAGPAKAGSVRTATEQAGVTPAASGSAAPAAAAAALKPVPRPVTKRAPASPVEEAPWYMQPWAWAAGAGAIVLLLLLALIGRRRKPRTAAGSSLADRFGAPPVSGSTDIDQDELLDQLSEHPEDIELHRELATLYYSRGDVEHFEAAAEAMHAHVTDPEQDEWQDVVRMGEDLTPSHPLFATDHATASAYDDYDDEAEHDASASAPTADEYAFAEEVEDDPMPGIPPLPPQKKLGEYHFDFDLTGPRTRETHALADSSDAAMDTAHTHASDAYDSGAFDVAGSTDDELATPGSHGPIETAAAEPEPISTWNFDEPKDFDVASESSAEASGFGQFSDDPIDTKLDLARAYMDMGDAEGARAMLEEVQQEGNQMQQDAARHLLENIH